MALFIIFDVVQGAGVGSGSHDRFKGRAPGPIAHKLMHNLGFHLIFPHPGPNKTEQTPKCFPGYRAGLFDQLDFQRGFDSSQIMHNRRQTLIMMQRESLPAPFKEASVPGLNGNCGPQVLIGI